MGQCTRCSTPLVCIFLAHVVLCLLSLSLFAHRTLPIIASQHRVPWCVRVCAYVCVIDWVARRVIDWAARRVVLQESATLGPDLGDIRRFFKKHTASVEALAPTGGLVRVYFPRPVVCGYLTRKTRQGLQNGFDLSTEDTKHYSLVECLDAAHDEMQHRHAVSRSSALGSLITNLELWKNVSLVLAIILNICLLLGLGVRAPVGAQCLPVPHLPLCGTLRRGPFVAQFVAHAGPPF